MEVSTHVKGSRMYLLLIADCQLGGSNGRRRRDGLASLDKRDDLISLTAEIAVGAERVVPATLRAGIYQEHLLPCLSKVNNCCGYGYT